MKVDGILPLSLPPVAARARELERLGYDAALSAEVANDPFLPLLIAAEHTERVELMTSVAVAFARSPMTLAQTAHDLNAFSKGRLLLGLGSQVRAHVTRPLRVRDRIGDDRFFHMYYSEMMRDPISVMRSLYDWAGDELTDATVERMRRWLAEHPQDRFGSAAYSLEQYGLTVNGIRPVFDKYLAAFDIELEGTA